MSETPPPEDPKEKPDSSQNTEDPKAALQAELERLKQEKEELAKQEERKKKRSDNKVLSELQEEVERLKKDLEKEKAAKEKEKVKFLADSLIEAGYDAKDLEGYSSEDLERTIKLLNTKDGKIRIPRETEKKEEKTGTIELWNPAKKIVEDWNKRYET